MGNLNIEECFEVLYTFWVDNSLRILYAHHCLYDGVVARGTQCEPKANNDGHMGTTPQNMPLSSNSLLSPTMSIAPQNFPQPSNSLAISHFENKLV